MLRFSSIFLESSYGNIDIHTNMASSCELPTDMLFEIALKSSYKDIKQQALVSKDYQNLLNNGVFAEFWCKANSGHENKMFKFLDWYDNMILLDHLKQNYPKELENNEVYFTVILDVVNKQVYDKLYMMDGKNSGQEFLEVLVDYIKGNDLTIIEMSSILQDTIEQEFIIPQLKLPLFSDFDKFTCVIATAFFDDPLYLGIYRTYNDAKSHIQKYISENPRERIISFDIDNTFKFDLLSNSKPKPYYEFYD